MFKCVLFNLNLILYKKSRNLKMLSIKSKGQVWNSIYKYQQTSCLHLSSNVYPIRQYDGNRILYATAIYCTLYANLIAATCFSHSKSAGIDVRLSVLVLLPRTGGVENRTIQYNQYLCSGVEDYFAVFNAQEVNDTYHYKTKSMSL